MCCDFPEIYFLPTKVTTQMFITTSYTSKLSLGDMNHSSSPHSLWFHQGNLLIYFRQQTTVKIAQNVAKV